MKISVITAVFNRHQTIRRCLESVLAQQNCDLEYVVVDGMSNDGTESIVDEYADRIQTLIREPDDGIYDALNKGVLAATGDIVGFLHADDLFADTNVLQRVTELHLNEPLDASYGDLQYIDSDSGRVVRHWVSKPFNRKKFYFGWMPPHPTVYIRKSCYLEHGLYNLDMPTAADYELLVRMMVAKEITVGYVPHVMVKMQSGGSSNASIKNRLNANRDDREAWRRNGLTPPPLIRFTKPLRKLPQFLFSRFQSGSPSSKTR